MTFLPVVSREMGVLARRQSTYRVRSVTAVVAVLVMVWLLVVSASQVSMADLGSSIFLILSSFCFGFCLLVGMQATADCVSEEKREGTLGLLFLTDLRAIDITLGKLAASSLNALLAVLGVVPMLSLAVLLGGVTLTQVALTSLVLVNCMFLSLCLGVLVSTLSKNERKAMFACFVGLFVLTVMPFALSAALTEFQRLEPKIVWLSPLYTFICLHGVPAGAFGTQFFWVSLIFQNLLGWLFLLGAAYILPRCINELPARRFVRIRAAIDAYVYGRKEQRERYRAELLDRNAFLWLASRERIKPRYAWGLVAFFILLFLWVGLLFRNIFFDPPVPLMIIMLVHFVFKLWTASEVCTRLINDRRSGALELLLSSPLGEREIAAGQNLALRRIFAGPICVLLLAEMVLLAMTLKAAPPTVSRLNTVLLYSTAATTLVLDLWALKWVGLWLSLFGKSIERVLLATIARVAGVPALLFGVIASTLTAVVALQNERVPSATNHILWWTLGVACSAGFGLTAKRNFLRHFREAAAEQVSARAFSRQARKSSRKPNAPTRRPNPGWLLPLRVAARQHWVLTGTVAVLAIVFVVAFGRQVYWKRQVGTELAELRRDNQPTSAAEIGRVYAPLPSGEDAFARLRSSGGLATRGWVQPSHGHQLMTKWKRTPQVAVEECEAILTGNPAQVEGYRQLRRFENAYLDPFSVDAWRLPVNLPGYIAIGAADLVMALHRKDAAGTRAGLATMLHFARLLRAQPMERLQQLCFQALFVSGDALEFALANNLLSDGDLLELQLELEKAADNPVLKRMLSIERARLIDKSGKPDPRSGFTKTPVVLSAANGFLSAVGSYDELLARALREFKEVSKMTAAPRVDLLNAPAANQAVLIPAPIQRLSFNSYGSSVFSIIYNDTIVAARIELLRTALAVERYRLVHSGYPESLRQLAPKFIEEVPRDPFTNEPFECTETSGAFVIHSPEGTKRSGVIPERLSLELAKKL